MEKDEMEHHRKSPAGAGGGKGTGRSQRPLGLLLGSGPWRAPHHCVCVACKQTHGTVGPAEHTELLDCDPLSPFLFTQSLLMAICLRMAWISEPDLQNVYFQARLGQVAPVPLTLASRLLLAVGQSLSIP